MEQSTNQRKAVTRLLSIGLAAAGVGALVGLFLLGSSPSSWWLWLVFALAFVSLEFASVEVSDRVRVSSSAMVAFTAAVVFGREAAAPSVALMAAVAMLQPEDVSNRRWQQPLANLGQLVLSSSAGVLLFALFLPTEPLAIRHLPLVLLGAALGASVYNYCNYQLVAGFVRFAYPGRSMPPWSSMISSHLALSVLAVLGALLGAAYLMVGPVITPLILATYLVGHVGFQTHARLREAHESTIRGLVKVVEALDPHTKGHTERVAHFCRIIGEEMGLDWKRLERLRWAALLHEVSKLALPGDMAKREEALTPEEYEVAARHRRVVDGVLAEVGFLRPMVEITAAAHALLGEADARRRAPLESRILAAASHFDMKTTTRSYREAVTQAQAFDLLREQADRFGMDVLDAFEIAVVRRGEVYGSPDELSLSLAERQVRERAIRA